MAHDHQPSENTPLIPPSDTSSHRRRGSVVSYTYQSQECANVTTKDQGAAKSTKRKLILATGLALLFFATELVCGYFANSLGKITFLFSYVNGRLLSGYSLLLFL